MSSARSSCFAVEKEVCSTSSPIRRLSFFKIGLCVLVVVSRFSWDLFLLTVYLEGSINLNEKNGMDLGRVRWR